MPLYAVTLLPLIASLQHSLQSLYLDIGQRMLWIPLLSLCLALGYVLLTGKGDRSTRLFWLSVSTVVALLVVQQLPVIHPITSVAY